MKEKKKQWENDLAKLSEQFAEQFSHLSAEQINFKPAPQKWSIAEIIEHIIKVNESYYPVIEKIRSGKYKAPFAGRFNIISEFFGNMIYKSVHPNQKKKIRTFNIWKPESSAIKYSIPRFVEHQDELKKKIAGLSHEMLNTPIPSPVSSAIIYKLHKAVDIMIQHEKRHFEQAREVLQKIEAVYSLNSTN